MTFAECIPHLLKGEAITRGISAVRKYWRLELNENGVLHIKIGKDPEVDDGGYALNIHDLMATDWEVTSEQTVCEHSATRAVSHL